VIARAVGARSPNMPAYVTMPKSEAFGYQGAVYLGAAYQPFEVRADPSSPVFASPNLSLPKGLTIQAVRGRSAMPAVRHAPATSMPAACSRDWTPSRHGPGDGDRRPRAGGL
jgi:hypothetical protein